MSDPIMCIWRDGAFYPSGNYHTARCHDRFGEGELVALEVEAERSVRSHRHYFATIADLWQNLPERLAEAPYAKTPETLRKHALIATGYADCETIDAGSKAAAERVAALVGTLATKAHGYCIVKVSGPVVRCYTPQTQSYRGMGAKLFQSSKDSVLDWIETLVKVDAA